MDVTKILRVRPEKTFLFSPADKAADTSEKYGLTTTPSSPLSPMIIVKPGVDGGSVGGKTEQQ